MKSIPSAPVVIIRSVLPTATHLYLEHENGNKATLTAISKDCVPYSFWCEITLKSGKQMNVSSEFLDFENLSMVPDTHKSRISQTAWLCCHYRNEAYSLGMFAPVPVEGNS